MKDYLELVIKDANRLFIDGQFLEAKELYVKANHLSKSNLYDINIQVCHQRTVKNESCKDTVFGLREILDSIEKQSPLHIEDLAEQLAKTQALLEHYYNSYQKLKNKS